MNKADYPLVSVGIPVFNEDKYLDQTLESLFKQDYPNFEIIISDNASTDNTGKITEKYRKLYPEILKYYRNDKNIGSILNFSRVLEVASGEFFMWAGSHDLLSHCYISESVKVLESNLNVVSIYPRTIWIDQNDNVLNTFSGFVDTRGQNVICRFNQILWANQHAIYGLMRSSILKQTRGLKQITASGAILLAELALLGDFAFVQEAIWYRREFREDENRKQQRSRYKRVLYANKNSKRYFSYWRIPIEIAIVIWQSSLSFSRKLSLTFSSIPAVIVRYIKHMLDDILNFIVR
ncbi:MAG: glycosyltransferase family 2 protein [Calditrichia bacterium]|nr:glycosyltransferase family 2 protein [Calditrichia bacterium]